MSGVATRSLAWRGSKGSYGRGSCSRFALRKPPVRSRPQLQTSPNGDLKAHSHKCVPYLFLRCRHPAPKLPGPQPTRAAPCKTSPPAPPNPKSSPPRPAAAPAPAPVRYATPPPSRAGTAAACTAARAAVRRVAIAMPGSMAGIPAGSGRSSAICVRRGLTRLPGASKPSPLGTWPVPAGHSGPGRPGKKKQKFAISTPYTRGC